SLPNWIALPRTLPDELLHGLHVSLGKPAGQRLDGFPFAIQKQAAHVYLAPMAPLTPTHRFQQVHKKLLQPLPTTHRLGIGHAQTYQPFSVLSILNVVILGVAQFALDYASFRDDNFSINTKCLSSEHLICRTMEDLADNGLVGAMESYLAPEMPIDCSPMDSPQSSSVESLSPVIFTEPDLMPEASGVVAFSSSEVDAICHFFNIEN